MVFYLRDGDIDIYEVSVWQRPERDGNVTRYVTEVRPNAYLKNYSEWIIKQDPIYYKILIGWFDKLERSREIINTEFSWYEEDFDKVVECIRRGVDIVAEHCNLRVVTG